MTQILLIIFNLFSDPNPDNPLQPEIGLLYKNNREEFNKKAREWTLEIMKN